MARNVAITIGVNHYQYEQSLRFAENDALAMRTYLQKTGFEEVLHYSDQTADRHPELTTLLRAVRRISSNVRLGQEDSFWFFFSGHGGRQQGRDFLLPSNGDPDDLARTAIAIDEVIRALRECGAGNLILILDACRNPVLEQGKNIGNQTIELVKQEGIITLFSCSPGEKSYELPKYKHGALTYALLKALQGDCKPHCCNAKQLSRYLRQAVPQLTQALGQQRPYVIAEPIEKATQTLLPSSFDQVPPLNPSPAAVPLPQNDVAQLVRNAVRTTQHQEWDRAKRLWEQVLVEASDPEDRKLAMEQRDYVVSQQNASNRQNVALENNTAAQHNQTLTATEHEVRSHPSHHPSSTPQRPVARQPFLHNKSRDSSPLSATQIPQLLRRDVLKWLGFGGVGAATIWILGRWQGNEQNPDIVGESTTSLPNPTTERPPVGSGSSETGQAAKQSTAQAISTERITLEKESVTVNEQGQIQSASPVTVDAFTEDLGNGVTFPMVQIPSGTFMMGSPASEAGRDDSEGPQHSVNISSFFMGMMTVTQAVYEAVMGENPSSFKGSDRPVEFVYWNDAIAFCQKLSDRTGKEYRLPSEAEWEYACRAGTTSPFHFGSTPTTDIANYDGTYSYGRGPESDHPKQIYGIGSDPAHTTMATPARLPGEHPGSGADPVGSFPPNAFGLHDMHGNVWEWCADHWHDNYHGAPSDNSAWTSGGISFLRVLRGGSWFNVPWGCRSASRARANAGYLDSLIGFRLVCSLPKIS